MYTVHDYLCVLAGSRSSVNAKWINTVLKAETWMASLYVLYTQFSSFTPPLSFCHVLMKIMHGLICLEFKNMPMYLSQRIKGIFRNKTSLKPVIGMGINVKKKREQKEQGTWGRKPKGLGPSKTGILIFEQTVTLKQRAFWKAVFVSLKKKK